MLSIAERNGAIEGMVDLIKEISELGLGTTMLGFFLALSAIVGIKAGIKKFKDIFGLVDAKELEHRELLGRISTLEEKVKEVDKRVTDTSTMYDNKLDGFHQQSIDIRGNLANDIASVKGAQDDIKASLLDLKNMFIDNEIDTIRFEILDFANAVMDHRNYNKEQYDHVFDIYEKYERILAENGLENGRVDMSMQFLKNKYAELMQTGFNR